MQAVIDRLNKAIQLHHIFAYFIHANYKEERFKHEQEETVQK